MKQKSKGLNQNHLKAMKKKAMFSDNWLIFWVGALLGFALGLLK